MSAAVELPQGAWLRYKSTVSQVGGFGRYPIQQELFEPRRGAKIYRPSVPPGECASVTLGGTMKFHCQAIATLPRPLPQCFLALVQQGIRIKASNTFGVSRDLP